MKEEGLFKIPEEDLKKIKTFKEYDDYFQILYKQGIQALLKAEMQQHLGYAKNDPQGKKSGNSRNGYSGKVLRPTLGRSLWRSRVTVTLRLTRWWYPSTSGWPRRLNMPLCPCIPGG